MKPTAAVKCFGEGRNIVIAETKSESPAYVGERHIVHIINPVSGSGIKFRRTKKRIDSLGEDVYLTTGRRDCEEFIFELLTKDPTAHVVAHGGDGTMSEAVSGIMAAKAGETALFTGIPSGSGNDFLHYMYSEKNEIGKIYPTDLIFANGRYSINITNVGFDCSVVSEAEKIRKIPGMGGAFSYIAGVASTLIKKESFKTKIVFENVIGNGGITEREELSGDFLLAAIANGAYYGGGFKVAPVSDAGDGFFDVIVVKNVSVPKFISLVADFKKGSHINAKTHKVKESFAEYLTFKRCKKVSFDGIREVCFDGEIAKAKSVEARILPKAVAYTPPKKEWLE